MRYSFSISRVTLHQNGIMLLAKARRIGKGNLQILFTQYARSNVRNDCSSKTQRDVNPSLLQHSEELEKNSTTAVLLIFKFVAVSFLEIDCKGAGVANF